MAFGELSEPSQMIVELKTEEGQTKLASKQRLNTFFHEIELHIHKPQAIQ